MRLRRFSFKQRRGQQPRAFSLIEMALVFAVIAVVIGGIWTAYSSVQENRKVTQLMGDVLGLVQGARSLVGTSLLVTPNQVTDITTALIRANVAPAGMIKNAILTQPWNDIVTVEVSNTTSSGACGAANYERFRIIVNNLPENACRQLIARLTAAAGKNSPDLCLVWIGSTAYTQGAMVWSNTPVNFPIAPDLPTCTNPTPMIILNYSMTR